MLLIKNDKKRDAALKNEAGGDEKHLFFFYLALNSCLDKKSSQCRADGQGFQNTPRPAVRIWTARHLSLIHI